VSPCNPNGDFEEKWYSSTGFFALLGVGGALVLAIAAYSMVKYYKYRQLYEAYAQLDRDRGNEPSTFDSFPSDLELEMEDVDNTPMPTLGRL